MAISSMKILNKQIALSVSVGAIAMIALAGGCSFDKLRLNIDRGSLDPNRVPLSGAGRVSSSIISTTNLVDAE